MKSWELGLFMNTRRNSEGRDRESVQVVKFGLDCLRMRDLSARIVTPKAEPGRIPTPENEANDPRLTVSYGASTLLKLSLILAVDFGVIVGLPIHR